MFSCTNVQNKVKTHSAVEYMVASVNQLIEEKENATQILIKSERNLANNIFSLLRHKRLPLQFEKVLNQLP